MFDALYVGATGMRSQQLQIDAIAHNLANLNTVGFRRSVSNFSEVVAALANNRAVLDTDGVSQVLRGSGVTALQRLSSLPGELRQTGELLDVAIDGMGFIEVVRADGTPAYTRAGNLRINEERLLAAQDGSPLAARIEIPEDARDLRIDPNGRVSAVVGENELIELGQIELAAFANPAGLSAAGANLYVNDGSAGEPQVAFPGEQGLGLLRQGYVEGSNVRMADEMVTLMIAQRAFELNARVVQIADQLMQITNGLYR